MIAELLLRGSQTEGDLRARASRMEPLPDLAALQTVLESLAAKDLVVYLTPPGVRRGVVVTHNLYPPDEMERERPDTPAARRPRRRARPRPPGPLTGPRPRPPARPTRWPRSGPRSTSCASGPGPRGRGPRRSSRPSAT